MFDLDKLEQLDRGLAQAARRYDAEVLNETLNDLQERSETLRAISHALHDRIASPPVLWDLKEYFR
ncbi:MAG: hypothetical protein AAGF71_01920 [Pseudomonadota bacterium]